jgi:hypothetical protein
VSSEVANGEQWIAMLITSLSTTSPFTVHDFTVHSAFQQKSLITQLRTDT